MPGITNYLQNELLDGTVAGSTYTAPANVYLGLYTVAPTSTTTGTEVTGNGYSRQLITFGTPAANGAITNTANVSFTASGGNFGLLPGSAILDASTGGNIMYFSSLNRTVNDGDTLNFVTGKINITMS